jgi:hypothetical protein
MLDIVHATPDVKMDLAALTVAVCRHHKQVGATNGTALDAAMACGDALILVRDKIKIPHGGWKTWLKSCSLQDRTARRYIQLANGRRIIESKRSSTTDIAGALRLLGNNARSSDGKTKNLTKPPALSSLAWSEASVEQRRHFLDGVGLSGILEAMPPAWRSQLQRTHRDDLAIEVPHHRLN